MHFNSLAKSGELGGFSRGMHILGSVHKKYATEGSKVLKPTKWMYNNVINACALTKHEKEENEALLPSTCTA
jgi:hypothetical protein